MDSALHELAFEQIRRYRHEILILRFTFSITNCLSLLFLGYVFHEVLTDNKTVGKDYVELLKAAAAIIAPYLTIIAQGYSFPRYRKINSLQYLIDENKAIISPDEAKIIFDTNK